MEYSLMQAAERAGLSKATIHRAVKSGRLSARRGEGGAYRIDASELARVYPETSHEPTAGQVESRPETAEMTAVLQERVLSLETQLADAHEVGRRERETARDSIDDLRRRLDRAEERVLALTAISAVTVAPTTTTVQPAPRGLLGRLLGWAGSQTAT